MPEENKKEEKVYQDGTIEVLEGLDAVRKRPGMYIGSTDSHGLHHLVWEIVDNAVDEALNGYGNEIKITLHKDDSVSVEDHGRGMPTGIHPTKKIPTIAVIFTILHAGGKFSDKGGYVSAGGLHGVGASVVNALSTKCEVTVKNGTNIYQMTFSDGGRKMTPLECIGETTETGSTVRFYPNPEIFKDHRYNFNKIAERAQEASFLLSGLKMVVVDERKDEPHKVEYCYENGLQSFIEELNANTAPLHKPKTFSGTYEGIKVDGCFQYTDNYTESIYSFTNMVRTKDGGTHETGAKQAFTKVINDYARKNNFLKEKDKSFDGQDIREGMTLVINLTIPENLLQFESQTKEKLGTPLAKQATESVLTDALREFLTENQSTADEIVKKVVRAKQAREASRKARDEARKGKTKQKAEKVLSGKLADAQAKSPEFKELYLVEGDSAGGSAKQGRDSRYQAILPLRGKVLNTQKASMEAIAKNVELNTIIHAIGVGIGKDFNPELSNYNKVIIMSDADDDGYHIQILLMTFFYRYMRRLIDAGMLYIAMPPLYRIKKGKQVVYLFTDDELNEKKKEFGSGYTVTRYKGLGEMNAEQLWETTMNPATRTMIRVAIEDGRLAEKRFNELMGDNAEARRGWIEENVVFEIADDFKIQDSKE